MKIQSRDLVMFAMGCEGEVALWDDRTMEEGIHLRWGFRPELGFPLGGFDLYRCPHRAVDPICSGFPQQPGTIYTSPWQVHSNITLTSDQNLKVSTFGTNIGVALDVGTWVRVTFAELARWVRVTVVASTPVVLTAYHGSMPVGQAEASGTAAPEELTVKAAAIDALELSQATGIMFLVCQVPVSQGAFDDWEKLNKDGPIALPITKQPAYPLTHPHAPDDKAEAECRVPPEVWERYSESPWHYSESPWQTLHDQLEFLVNDAIPVPMAFRKLRIRGRTNPPPPPNTQEPEILLWPLQQTLAASLDHNLARILGLYWLDEATETGQTYDYKLVGHWDRAGRVTCPTAVHVDFSQVPGGTIFGTYFKHRGLFFANPMGFEVTKQRSPWGDDTDRALCPNTWFSVVQPMIQIRFPQTVAEVQIYAQSSTSGASLRAYDKNGSLVDQATAATKDALLTVQATAISYVDLTGDQLRLFGVCYLTTSNAPGDRAWIVFNVSRGIPKPLTAPDGTRAVQLPGMPLIQPDGSLAGGTNNLALRWDLPVEYGKLQPGRPLMYRVQRQSLGAQTPPDPIVPEAFEDVSHEPVLVTRPRIWMVVDEGTISAPSEWKLEKGVLRQTSNIFGGSFSPTDLPKPGTCALAGRLEWKDYQLTLRLRSDDNDAIGVVFRYQDRNNYYRFSMDSERKYRRLVKCFKGKFYLLWQDAVAYNKKQTYGLRVVVRRSRLQGWIDGALLFDMPDGDLTHGLIGLYCWGNTGAYFYHVRVTPPTVDKPVLFEDDFTDSMVARLPQGWPTYPTCLLDQGISDGWYAYRVAGIDIFGRLSDFSKPAVIHAIDRTPPPPPVMLEAKALQARPAGVPESVIDRMLTSTEQAWLKAHPGGGLKVSWVWPGEMRRQAPDADEFRVYLQTGQVNTIAGWVTKVAPDGPERSKLTTDQSTTLLANAFKSERVRVGLNIFQVVGSSSGTNFSLTVKNLTNPEYATNKKAPKWIQPDKAAFSLALSAVNPLYVDYRKPKHWQDRLHVEPLGTLPAPAGKITKRVDHKDDSCTVTTDATLTDPKSAEYPKGRTVPGVLISDGQLFYAEKHTSGANFEITVRAIESPTGLVRPVVGHKFMYYPGYRYTVTLSSLPLKPTSADPMAYGQVGVSTADDKQHAKDDPARTGSKWGNRRGNEGSVSPPHAVFAIKRDRPDKLPGPPDSEMVYAEPADYFGHSRYTLRWKRASDLTLCYQVYRAMDESLFAADKANLKVYKQRAALTPNSPWLQFLDSARRPAVIQELKPKDLNYSKLSNDALQVLASLPVNEAAFTLLTQEALDPTSPKTKDPTDTSGQTLRYTDTLNGRASNRYFYRVVVMDRAGNLSDLADSTPPIYLPDTTPPRAPLPVKALGGERKVILTWQANREPGMDHYLVYRTTDKTEAEDIRQMGKSVAKKPHPTTPQVGYEDKGLTGPITYYYRLVAVRKGQIGPNKVSDVVELSSPASEVMAARAYDLTPPDPPTWVRAEWVQVDDEGKEHPWGTVPPPSRVYTPAVALEWSSTEHYARWVVQRKVKDTELWRTVSSWLNANGGNGKFTDKLTSSDAEYVYRIRGEDVSGKVNTVFNEQTVPKAGTV